MRCGLNVDRFADPGAITTTRPKIIRGFEMTIVFVKWEEPAANTALLYPLKVKDRWEEIPAPDPRMVERDVRVIETFVEIV